MEQEQHIGESFDESVATGLRPAKGVWGNLTSFARRKPLGAIGATLAFLLLVVAVFAPLIKTHDENRTSTTTFQPPSTDHLLGTDSVGRDIFSRIVVGARLTMQVALISAFVGCGTGLVVGVTSAYFGGLIDLLVQRIVDGLIAFPALVLAIALIAALSENPLFGEALYNVILALCILFIPNTARIIRSQALAIREMDYIVATRSVGASDLRIILRHLLPNCLAVWIVMFTFQIGIAVIAEAGLSFLGLGVGPDVATWGGMLQEARQNFIGSGLWLPLFPGLAIAILVFSWNLLGDSLRDVWDPRLRGTD